MGFEQRSERLFPLLNRMALASFLRIILKGTKGEAANRLRSYCNNPSKRVVAWAKMTAVEVVTGAQVQDIL